MSERFNVADIFGEDVFNDTVMQERLPKKVYKALKNQMAELYEELKRIEQFSEENEELLYTLQLVAETLNGMKEDED